MTVRLQINLYLDKNDDTDTTNENPNYLGSPRFGQDFWNEDNPSNGQNEGVLGKIKAHIAGEPIDSVFNTLMDSLNQLQLDLKAKNKPSNKEICKYYRLKL